MAMRYLSSVGRVWVPWQRTGKRGSWRLSVGVFAEAGQIDADAVAGGVGELFVEGAGEGWW